MSVPPTALWFSDASGSCPPSGAFQGIDSAAPVAAGNLLTWTEQFDNPAWEQSGGVVVIPNDADAPDATHTADLIADTTTSSAVRQVTTVAASTGAAVTKSLLDVLVGWNRYELTGVFDGTSYTFSVYLNATEAGVGYRMRLDRSGGFLRCSLEDIGDAGSNWAWGAQLEVGASATAYVSRTS